MNMNGFEATCSPSAARGTKEMVQPCLIHLHVVSLVAHLQQLVRRYAAGAITLERDLMGNRRAKGSVFSHEGSGNTHGKDSVLRHKGGGKIRKMHFLTPRRQCKDNAKARSRPRRRWEHTQGKGTVTSAVGNTRRQCGFT